MSSPVTQAHFHACMSVFAGAGFCAVPLARWGRKRLRAVANASSFDSTFSVAGSGVDGYANPSRLQAANTASIATKQKKVPRDSFTIGDSVRSDRVVISTRNRGRKKRVL